jgi:hypothetical protein
LVIGISSRSTVDQAVLDLQSDEGRPPPHVGKRVRLRDPPGRGIRDAGVEHLALANQIIQPSHDLFDRRDLVPDVDPVKVDIIGLQPLEACFHCLHHTLAVVAGRVRVRARNSIGGMLKNPVGGSDLY